MRYLFVNGAEEVWGAEESMVVLARSLIQSGHEVSLDCFSKKIQDFWSKEVNFQTRLVVDNSQNMTNFQKCKAYTFVDLGIHAPDIVIFISHFLFPKVAAEKIKALFLPVAKKQNRVWALDLHDNFKSWKSFINLNFFARFADRIISVSKFTAAQLPKSSQRKTLVCTRALELSHRKFSTPKKFPKSQNLRVGIVGRLDPEKNHQLLAEAMSRTSYPHELIVRGKSSNYFPEYSKSLLQNLQRSLGDRLKYEGVVPRNAALSNLDLLVVCNSNEPMGRTVLEAMDVGVPVVVPDKGGSAELVQDGLTGLKYKANDPVSLAEVLDFASSQPQLLENCARQAFDKLVNEHNAASYGQIINSFMMDKLSGRRTNSLAELRADTMEAIEKNGGQ